MKLPFDADELSDALREPLAARHLLTAAHALEEAIESTPAPALGHVLGALAYCVFEEALEFMVDEVVVRGQRSLELLARARKAGLPAELAKGYRAKVRRLLKREQAREAKVLALVDQDPETLDLEAARDLAYLLDDKGGARNAGLAARLWACAARDPLPHKAGFARCRLALSLWAAGEREQARPLLEAVLRKEVAGYPDDSYMLLAGNRLLEEALESKDSAQILSTWQRLHKEVTTRSEERLFPYAVKLRMRLLREARERGLQPIVEHLS